MNCPRCTAKCSGDAVFCVECGHLFAQPVARPIAVETSLLPTLISEKSAARIFCQQCEGECSEEDIWCPSSLKPREIAHFLFPNVTFFQERVVNRAIQGQYVSQNAVIPLDTGSLVITSQRLIFTGSEKGFSYLKSKLLNLTLRPDGFSFIVDSQAQDKKPYHFTCNEMKRLRESFRLWFGYKSAESRSPIVPTAPAIKKKGLASSLLGLLGILVAFSAGSLLFVSCLTFISPASNNSVNKTVASPNFKEWSSFGIEGHLLVTNVVCPKGTTEAEIRSYISSHVHDQAHWIGFWDDYRLCPNSYPMTDEQVNARIAYFQLNKNSGLNRLLVRVNGQEVNKGPVY